MQRLHLTFLYNLFRFFNKNSMNFRRGDLGQSLGKQLGGNGSDGQKQERQEVGGSQGKDGCGSSSRHPFARLQRMQNMDYQNHNRKGKEDQRALLLDKVVFSAKGAKLQWKFNDKFKDMGLRETDSSLRQQRTKKRSISIQDFRCVKLLGKGKHGTVYSAVHQLTGFIGALKIFRKQDFHSESTRSKEALQDILIRQLKIQSYISHSHILQVYSIFSDANNVYLFMELGVDGELLDLFQTQSTLKQESVSFLMRGLFSAVSHLHSHHIIHRDIKPENIVLIHVLPFLCKGFPKLCDFGESSVCNREKGQLRETLCGTPLYLSPEILMGEKYDEKIDVWALGAMAFQLVTGRNVFDITHKDELSRVITEEFKMVTGSVELRNFLAHVLKKKAKERPSARKMLLHPFVQKWGQLQTSEQLCK